MPRSPSRSCAERLKTDIRQMLKMDIAHGDLSAYNILIHAGEPVIIDVPQAMALSITPNAFSMMVRDLGNLEDFFMRRGVETSFSDLLY